MAKKAASSPIVLTSDSDDAADVSSKVKKQKVEFIEIEEKVEIVRTRKKETKIVECLKEEDLECLNEGQMLKGKLVNEYLKLLSHTYSHIYCFETDFMTFLLQNHQNKYPTWVHDEIARRRPRLIFIPIHNENPEHWHLIMINLRNQKLVLYDSLYVDQQNERYKNRLNKYEELITKLMKELYGQHTVWSFDRGSESTPKQQNYYDCGVFMLKFVEYLAQYKQFDFTQKDIPRFRNEMRRELSSPSIFQLFQLEKFPYRHWMNLFK